MHQDCLKSETMTNGLQRVHNSNMRTATRNCLQSIFVAAGWAWIASAQATLGGDAASVTADAAVLHGLVRLIPGRPFTVLEIAVDNGMRVRELLDGAGLVCAVSWTGPAPPDLSPLLGPYYGPFAAALSALPSPGRRRSVHVQTAGLVVDLEGHLRAYAGRAYLPGRVPAGISQDSLR